MAQQDGLIKFKGQMGGISFYKTAEDGYLARQKGGIDAERIKNSPEFVRTRENGAEFGRAGVAAKLLRTALRSVTINASDSRMASRLTSEMVKVVQADLTNPRGKRNVIDGEAELLKGFEFNINSRLKSCLVAPYSVSINRATGVIVVDIAGFDPRSFIVGPQGATHARVVTGFALIDFETETLVTDDLPSSMIDLSTDSNPGFNATVGLTPNSTKPIFVALGIEFYQRVNGQMYSLRNGAFNALALVAVNGGV